MSDNKSADDILDAIRKQHGKDKPHPPTSSPIRKRPSLDDIRRKLLQEKDDIPNEQLEDIVTNSLKETIDEEKQNS